jgi:DNA-binding MarR family transcriptional regulator
LNSLDLTTAGYTMLFVLRRLPDLSNASLARRAGVTPQATNLTVLALAERGLIRRRPSADNNRILENRLTASGQRMIERCEAEAEDVESTMLEGFSTRERDQFERLLRRSAVNLGIHL